MRVAFEVSRTFAQSERRSAKVPNEKKDSLPVVESPEKGDNVERYRRRCGGSPRRLERPVSIRQIPELKKKKEEGLQLSSLQQVRYHRLVHLLDRVVVRWL